jgi:hypothetical protein
VLFPHDALASGPQAYFFAEKNKRGARGMNKLTGPWGSINMVFDEFMIQPAFIFVEPCGRGTGHRASGEERSFERS